MTETLPTEFDLLSFLTQQGVGTRTVRLKAKQTLFAQGQLSDCVYYLQSGRVRLTVVSSKGKEATISLISAEDFLGEESVAGPHGQRLATATALSACSALRIDRETVIRTLHEEPSFCDLFLKLMVRRSMRTQADLIDQLFNSSEKRLARILLLMAEVNTTGESLTLIPPVTQEALAEMIGTTRSRVSFFMNRFRKHGFIQYKGRIHVHKSLLNVVLHDQPSEGDGAKPAPLLDNANMFSDRRARMN